MYRFLCKTEIKGIAIILWVVAMSLFLFPSCGGDKKEFVEVVFNADSTYTMRTASMTTLVSDSGITRYKLVTEEWLDFDEAADPYSFFPQKVHLEKFDSLFHVEASVDADTAYFFKKRKLWKLIDNVRIQNLEGMVFESSVFYWDQVEGKVYSDREIYIRKGDFVNTGVGFEANETLTKWRIFDSKAEIPFDEAPADTLQADNSALPMENGTLEEKKRD